MSEKIERAKQVFSDICTAIKELGINSNSSNPDGLEVVFGVRGNDIPIVLRISVLPEEQMVCLKSNIPINVPEEKRLAMAFVINCVNCNCPVGNFCFDLKKGKLFYKNQAFYIDSTLGVDQFKQMIEIAKENIDKYNDSLFKLSKGHMSLREFFKLYKF